MYPYFLLPASLIYGLITAIRNKLYDEGLLKSYSHSIPVISIGNINTGGTGKTPLTEYLAEMLQRNFRVAVLSRGYKRKSKGFIIAGDGNSYRETGDEAWQVHIKFPGITVAVCEKRLRGIKNLLRHTPSPEVIVLDDAFQHRQVKPGLSILLTAYNDLYIHDLLLPSGRLRECKSGAKRADIIIITKCPQDLSMGERRELQDLIRPLPHRSLLFSTMAYSGFLPFGQDIKAMEANRDTSVLLVTGIADPRPLENYLKESCKKIITIHFPDHHDYTPADEKKIRKAFNNISGKNKLICITEKDRVKINTGVLQELISDLPVYYIAVKTEFFENDHLLFNKIIENYVSKNQRNG